MRSPCWIMRMKKKKNVVEYKDSHGPMEHRITLKARFHGLNHGFKEQMLKKMKVFFLKIPA